MWWCVLYKCEESVQLYSFVKPECIKFNSVKNDWMHYWNNHETSIIISITELQGSFPVRNVLSNTLLNLIMFHKINRSLVPMAALWLSVHWTPMSWSQLKDHTIATKIPQKAWSDCQSFFAGRVFCNMNPLCANLTRCRDKGVNSC